MKNNVISINSRYRKRKESDQKPNNLLGNKLTKTQLQFDRLYTIEKNIENTIGYNKKDYDQKVGWSIFGLSMFYVYSVASLLGSHDSIMILALILLGELCIFGVCKKLFNVFKNIQLAKSQNTLSSNKINNIKTLIKEKEELKKSIKNTSPIDYKYVHKYIGEEAYRENLFKVMNRYIENNKDDNLNSAAEYATKQIKKLI